MLKVLGRTSSINVRKVLWLCSELDLTYELEPWGEDPQSLHSAEFMALNPNAMVPVIIEDDFVMWESNAILRYLANSNGGDWLYPENPRGRAPVDQWMDWQATELNTSWRYAFMSLVRNSPAHQDPRLLAAAIKGWTHTMNILDQHLQKTGRYVAGRNFSLADIPVGLAVNRWFETPLEHPEFPSVQLYYERLTEREGYTTWGRNGKP
ncbi:glutathione S-transferase [Pantoea sp. JGM49]|uniref:glutathione S-transferase family protein n=1 Tax=Pantoea sp. JGM49 TaxID=2799791 RepID=UPI001BAA1770|nr:glutathione S-transferase [Pantoea sp. JGM49]MBS0882510.1 glutathione S-transferase [Pantoea sp. JGM49]